MKLLGLLCCFLGPFSLFSAPEPLIQTLGELWADYDPAAEPLETVVART